MGWIRNHVVGVIAIVSGVLACLPVRVAAQQKPPTVDEFVHGRAKALIARAAKDADYELAREEATRLLDWVIARAPDSATGAFRDAAFAQRLLTQLAEVREGRAELTAYLAANEELAQDLVFLVRAREESGKSAFVSERELPDDVAPAAVFGGGGGTGGFDRPVAVYKVLNDLRTTRPKEVVSFPTLVAALCVVRDAPPSSRAKPPGVETRPATTLEVFDHFITSEKQLTFDVRRVPPELLIFVVDAPISLEEMRWASGRYAKDTEVGRRFFEIRYDEQAFLRGGPKRVERADGGKILPNILKYGGVCEEQAYYASNVGKSIGVPSVYTWGRGGDMGHAWVGFLQQRGAKAFAWNFDAGRYEVYQGVRGNVADPQTGDLLNDSHVSLLAETCVVDDEKRYASIGLTDAASRVVLSASPNALPNVPPVLADALPTGRPRGAGSALALLRAAVEANPANARAWLNVQRLSRDAKLDAAQKRQWSDTLIKLCGQKYPEFVWDLMRPMIDTHDDPAEQDKLYESMLRLFTARKDLSANVRVAQGEMWEKRGNKQRAGKCYEDVVVRFANDGPFVLDALEHCEGLLPKASEADGVVTLYSSAWRRTQRPETAGAEFVAMSNWHRVGTRYAELLEEAGRTNDAQRVRTTLADDLAQRGAGRNREQPPQNSRTNRTR